MPGALAGLAGSFLIAPAEHIRIRLQVQSANQFKLYTGSMDAFHKISRKYGIKGLNKGLFSTMLREIGFCAGFFTFYEFSKRQIKETPQDEISPLQVFLAGGVTGIFTWGLIFPLDTLKSVAQTEPLSAEKRQYSGYFDMARSFIKRNGFRGLYRGLNVCLLRAFPVNAVTFSCYELARDAADKVNLIFENKDTKDFMI